MEHHDMYGHALAHPTEFAAANTFAEFAASLDASKPGSGRLLQHIAERYPDTWEASFQTVKHRPYVARALLLPHVTKASEIFADVSLYPYEIGGKYLHEYRRVQAGAAFISEHRANGFAYFGRLGATYEWSPRHSDKVRSVRGGEQWLTAAKPTQAVIDAYAPCGAGEWDLSTFEAVRRDDGYILIIVRCNNGFGDRYLCLLDPDETAMSMLSEHERGEIEAELARQQEAST
jgi:hypothetical protein